MFMLNNSPLPLDRAFTVNDVQYPANWLRLSTLAEKQALGITEVPDPVLADDRFYWSGDINNPKALEDKLEVKEDGTPLYVQKLDNTDPANPVMVDTDVQVVTKGLKSTMIAQVKATAGSMLATTDWMVIRKAERDVAIPDAVLTQRLGIVAEANRLEAAISSCEDVESLIAVMNTQNWSE